MTNKSKLLIRVVLVFFFISILLKLSAQQQVEPFFLRLIEDSGNRTVYPLINPADKDTGKSARPYIYRKVFKEHFIDVNNDGLILHVDPLMNLNIGQSSQKEELLYQNTRAFQIRGSLGKSLSFASSFYENQLTSPQWISDYKATYQVLPGRTIPKRYNGAYDYGRVFSRLNLHHQTEHVSMDATLGYDRFAIGRGYRSLFLTDFSLPYFFVSGNIEFNDFRYYHITGHLSNPNFGNIMELDETYQRDRNDAYATKYFSVHYFQWIPGSNFSLGFFESTVFQQLVPGENKFLWPANPIPLLNTAVSGLNGKQNVNVGMDALLHKDGFVLYSQLLADQFKKESLAWQFSLQYHNQRIHAIMEYNHIGSKVYAFDNPRQSYTHFNQFLGHPFGNHFDEIVINVILQCKSMELEARMVFVDKGDDTVFDNEIDTNDFTESLFFSGELRYIFNPNTRLQLFVRFDHARTLQKENFLSGGIKTQLFRDYQEVLPY